MSIATQIAGPLPVHRMSRDAEIGRGRSSQPIFRLFLLTLFGVAVHGYHLGTDDGAVYLPAVLKAIHPGLYPYGAEFFESHSRFSLFTTIVGASARLSRLSAEWVIFLWHLATIFAFLLAAWQLAAVCFYSSRARWSAMLLITVLLTLPAAGTALVLMDPYLTARSASTPLTIFAVAAFLAGKRRQSALWLLTTAFIHPLMAAFAAVFLAVLALPSEWTAPLFSPGQARDVAAAFPIGFSFGPATPGYRQSLDMRPFLFISQWTWYEWAGVAVPLGLLAWVSRLQPRGASPAFSRISRALPIFGALATLAAVLFAASPQLESFVRLQPMRAFHLIYIVFFLLLGGLLGEYVLKSRYWLWVSVYALIGAGMFAVQRKSYADSRHIEWPGVAPRNPWVEAFVWVRDNTPQDAVFALDPYYIVLPGEDQHGFRGIAERSVLSDHFKDSGVVSLFPQLAPQWAREQRAQQGWQHFSLNDFEKLARQYPVSWVLFQGAAPEGFACPYRNEAVTVCRIPGARGWN